MIHPTDIQLGYARPEFAVLFSAICAKHETREADWIADLRRRGVKAAHPDDGWVDREANTVHFAYPQFNDGVKVGDKIALGWPDKYRIVTVTNEVTGMFLNRWGFE